MASTEKKSESLLQAIGRQDVAEAARLLEAGADTNYVSQNGRTPLSAAASKGSAELIGLLLQKGAHAEPHYQYPLPRGDPLLIAIEKGHLECVRLLVEHGADLKRYKTEDLRSVPAPFLAVSLGQLPIFQFLCEHSPAELRALRGRAGETLLGFAAAAGQVAIVAYLLDQGVDINDGGSGGSTPLMLASKAGQQEVHRLLLARGADPGRESACGESALLIEAGRPEPDLSVLETLLSAGATQDVKRKDGKTALMLTVEARAVKRTLKDVTIEEPAYDRTLEAVQLLLDRGADVFAQGQDGETALSLAIRNGHHRAASLILTRVGDRFPDLKVPDANTPYELQIGLGKPRDLSPELKQRWRELFEVFKNPHKAAELIFVGTLMEILSGQTCRFVCRRGDIAGLMPEGDEDWDLEAPPFLMHREYRARFDEDYKVQRDKDIFQFSGSVAGRSFQYSDKLTDASKHLGFSVTGVVAEHEQRVLEIGRRLYLDLVISRVFPICGAR